MHFPLLTLLVPMLVAWPLQIVHCVLDRGARAAAKWFGFALLFAVVRELLIENTAPVYRLPTGLALPQFIPVAIGWTFAIYVGEMIGGAFTKGRTRDKLPFILPESMKASISAAVVTCLAFSMEAVAVGAGWWSWVPAVSQNRWMLHLGFTEMPAFVLLGWAGNGFVYPFVFDFLNDPRRARQYGAARFLVLLLPAFLFTLIVWGNWLFTTSLTGPGL
jgi:hypothetical protein